MSDSKALTVSEADYEAIEAAVMETSRGRWFLAEYARRNRNSDTQVLLEAIGRLESAVARERESAGADRVRFDLMEMARAIARSKSEIASIRPADGGNTDLFVASEALDGIVRTTEAATSDILEAAERIQEAAWTLREEGASPMMCDELDRRATEIYTACSFQDLTAQRTSRIIETLRFLEGRINSMIEIWGVGEAAEEVAARPDLSHRLGEFSGLSQDAVDVVIVDEGAPEEGRAPRSHARGADLAPPAGPVPLDEPTAFAHDEIAFEEVGETDAGGAAEPFFVDAAPEDEPLLVEVEDLGPAAPLADGIPVQPEPLVLEDTPLAAPRIAAFAAIDQLPAREKLRRFT